MNKEVISLGLNYARRDMSDDGMDDAAHGNEIREDPHQ